MRGAAGAKSIQTLFKFCCFVVVFCLVFRVVREEKRREDMRREEKRSEEKRREEGKEKKRELFA